MPARHIEHALEALSALRTCPSEDDRTRELQQALRNKANVIVAKAAALTAEFQLRALIPDLCAAFERNLINPAKSDPQCWAKNAIAKSLRDLSHEESEIFLKGARHVQLEPVWGGQQDTAATLRANCGLALLQCTDLTREDKLWATMRLLTEQSASLRKDAALALQSLEGREAALMLRIKARMGDSDPTVTGQIFESLLHLEGEAAIPFLVEFLEGPASETREEAALALGASRLSGAVAALKHSASARRSLIDSEILFRALSLSRSEDALRFLLEALRSRCLREALQVIEALSLYRHSGDLRKRVAECVAQRSEPEIQQQFERLFGTE